MEAINVDFEQLNTGTILLLIIFVVVLAAVCSIARNTIECITCPLRWTCAGLICLKNFVGSMCCACHEDGISVWPGDDDGL